MQLKSWPFLTDIKLLIIPLMFLLLRVWNFALDVAIFYTPESAAEHFEQSHAAAALIMMSVSLHILYITLFMEFKLFHGLLYLQTTCITPTYMYRVLVTQLRG